ncbi:MAG: hypothetical protein RQ758_04250 [Methanomicrobiaceae archaeon]|nr:hypothetical protein [Methanomicrobiaceae archaeon]
MRTRDRWLEERLGDPEMQASLRMLMVCCRLCAGVSLFIGFLVFLAVILGLL